MPTLLQSLKQVMSQGPGSPPAGGQGEDGIEMGLGTGQQQKITEDSEESL